MSKTPADCQTNSPPIPPVVMSIGGHDPTGGAGIQADIETLASLGCHGTSVLTAITCQDTRGVKDFSPCDASMLIAQARAVLEDMPIAAFKVGMLGTVEIAEAVHTLLQDYSDIPVVYDPVLAAGGGGTLSRSDLVQAIRHLILPLTTLITPNSDEAWSLGDDADNLESCVQTLLEQGCTYVLLTGGHEPGSKIVNQLWFHHKKLGEYTTERVIGHFHGTGCTLASACAAYLAHGANMETAVRDAQSFTSHTVAKSRQLGMGQAIPHRFFWSEDFIDA